jgi:hypothetical protein
MRFTSTTAGGAMVVRVLVEVEDAAYVEVESRPHLLHYFVGFIDV